MYSMAAAVVLSLCARLLTSLLYVNCNFSCTVGARDVWFRFPILRREVAVGLRVGLRLRLLVPLLKPRRASVCLACVA